MIHWLQNAKALNLGCPFYSHFMKWNWRPLSLKYWHFEAIEDIMTKFKSQGLYIIRIKYWNTTSAHWNIGILLHKQAKRRTIMHMTVCVCILYLANNWIHIFYLFVLPMNSIFGNLTETKTWFQIEPPSFTWYFLWHIKQFIHCI